MFDRLKREKEERGKAKAKTQGVVYFICFLILGGIVKVALSSHDLRWLIPLVIVLIIGTLAYFLANGGDK